MTGQTEPREVAIRGLEGAVSELVIGIRRYYQVAAEIVSPGLLPGAFKLLQSIDRRGPVSVSGLTEMFAQDKAQISRTVTELENLGLVARTRDRADARVRLLETTPLAKERLALARSEYSDVMRRVLDGWTIDSIDQLAHLLRELTSGITPGRTPS